MKSIVKILNRHIEEHPRNIFKKQILRLRESNYCCYIVVKKGISFKRLKEAINKYIGEDYIIELGCFESHMIYEYEIVSIVSDVRNKRLSIVIQDCISNDINRLGDDICIIDSIGDIII